MGQRRFSMPSKPPVQPPPGPSMSAPKDIPKTESPALPVPAPEAGKPAPPPAQKTASAAAPTQQGFNWEDFAKVKLEGPSGGCRAFIQTSLQVCISRATTWA